MTEIPCPHCLDGKTTDGRFCRNCGGLASVELGSPDEFCGHDYRFDRDIDRCLRVEKCAICRHEITIDSS